MTIALAIIGGIVVILAAATRIPLAAAAFLRACIPLITAIHDLREAVFVHHDHKASGEDLIGLTERSETDPLDHSQFEARGPAVRNAMDPDAA
jgi:hypothetical protein